MEIPFDVFDSIFRFLRSHPMTLVACSNALPALSQAIERYLYYHIRFRTRDNVPPKRTEITGYTLEPSYLIELLTKKPHIVNYIRILQIDLTDIWLNRETTQILQKITPVLPIFSTLECMILVAPSYAISWKLLPQTFKAAVENCLRLPTLQRLQLGRLCFPFPILDKLANINCFSLSGIPQIPDCSEGYNPQLTALSFDFIHDPHLTTFITWAKRHVFKLQSLKCDYSDEKLLSELLEVCSKTLNSLDLQFVEPYETIYDGLMQGEARPPTLPSINLSSLPRLQHLTIRGEVFHLETFDPDYPDGYQHVSRLPALIEILKTAPSLQHLTIDINVNLEAKFLSQVNVPFFTALAESAASFHHIDLYTQGLTAETIVPLLGEYGGVTALIEQGVVVIHMDETAPGDSRLVGDSDY